MSRGATAHSAPAAIHHRRLLSRRIRLSSSNDAASSVMRSKVSVPGWLTLLFFGIVHSALQNATTHNKLCRDRSEARVRHQRSYTVEPDSSTGYTIQSPSIDKKAAHSDWPRQLLLEVQISHGTVSKHQPNVTGIDKSFLDGISCLFSQLCLLYSARDWDC